MNFDLQIAGIWKRISASLFDFIVMAMLVAGLATALSALLGYDRCMDRVTAFYDEYAERYDVDFSISEEDYLKLSEEDRLRYEAANQAMNADPEAVYAYEMLSYLALVIVSISLLLAFLLLELALPLVFGNGQTLGKKIFGVAVIRSNGVRLRAPVLFVRAILGKYTIETMIPVLLIIMIFFGSLGVVGTAVILGIAAVQVIVTGVTRHHRAIHDLLSDTVAVELASQMIFDSEEERIAYIEACHREKAERASY